MKTQTLLIVLISLCCPAAFADYSIDWYTIDNGGGTMSGGKYTLTGTIGQHDAGYAYAGDYELPSGFWPGGPECWVDLEFFADFASHWLQSPCSPANNWCDGADLNHANDVNIDDFFLLAGFWMQMCPIGW